MVVMEYKLALSDDFRIGDTIRITNKTSTGWKAMINDKYEIVFEVNNAGPVPLLDGWILVDVNDRWEKMWVCLKDNNPFQVGFFKSEQEKMEKIKKNENLYLETLVNVEELEVLQGTNPQNPPIRFMFRTPSRSYNTILPAKDGMVTTARSIVQAIHNKDKVLKTKPMLIPSQTQTNIQQPQQQQPQQPQQQPLSRSAPQAAAHLTPHTNNHTHNNHAAPHTPHIPPQPARVQIQLPPPASAARAASPSPASPTSQSQIGGGKWLSNIKNIVVPKSSSSLNVTHKSKDDMKKAQSVMMSKSASSPEISALNHRNTQNVLLPRGGSPAAKVPEPILKDRKMLTRVYWRDGTYHTVPVTPGITAKEVCEFSTKKTKVAIFENLFCLYECLTDGTERILDGKTNVYELLSAWGEESENHLICDLNLGTKNTVKTQLRKTMAMSNRNTEDSEFGGGGGDSDSDFDDDFDQLEDLDNEPSEEDESIAMMIQEMIKLKHQLQEEDEMIERLAVEEQQVDLLISRLANL